MKEVEYKQGMTTVWSDGEKVVIKSPMGKDHIKTNVEQIFGVGEFDKLHAVKYTEDLAKTGRDYELVTGYIPSRVKQDLGYLRSKIKEKDPFRDIKDVS
jgi:hypothetical protein